MTNGDRVAAVLKKLRQPTNVDARDAMLKECLTEICEPEPPKPGPSGGDQEKNEAHEAEVERERNKKEVAGGEAMSKGNSVPALLEKLKQPTNVDARDAMLKRSLQEISEPEAQTSNRGEEY